MNRPTPLSTATLPVPKSISRSPLQHAFFIIALGCFGLSPMAKAVLPPPAPDGGYPGGNTAEGDKALFNLTFGSSNTAVGFLALSSNTIGGENTANGFKALYSNTTGFDNTANGSFALLHNTGTANTATGALALYHNTTGGPNTATGAEALESNTTGNYNTANGASALHNNTDGFYNTANGVYALQNNTIGNDNTAIGYAALNDNNTGSANVALGSRAGLFTTGSNNIDIGNLGVAGDDSTIRIGVEGTQTATFIAGISGATVTGTAVVVNSSGQLGVAPSSERFKAEIKPMDKASEAILALKPVTFRYKHELDPEGLPQFGLIAEEVAQVDPDLVVRDAEGKVFTVRYEAVNAMLLNEFLKEHKAFLEEHRTVQELEGTVARQQKQIEALSAGLQKVTAQLETSRSVQTVANNQ